MLKSTIRINAESEGEHTLLKDSFHSAPYKVIHYGTRHLHKHLELIMMSASPGIMDEDEISITVDVHEKAHLKLFTQSFSKLHPMKKGAVQKTAVNVKKHGVFKYIPHPVTPFSNAKFKTVNEIHLDKSATLIWGDIIASGRVYSGESFQFTSIHSITKIFRDKKLVLLDNQLLEPAWQPVSSILFYEDYTHQATLIFVSPYARELKSELDEILIGQYEQITFGFTECAADAIMLRAMGNEGTLLHDWLTTMGQLCWEFTMHKSQDVLTVVDPEKQSEALPPVISDSEIRKTTDAIQKNAAYIGVDGKKTIIKFRKKKAIEATCAKAEV
ncbi:urease accessory protein UreD [Dyadobacter flavalbus]|uniref:Urease accessory protein UreD n=1 Tax=Dyadobacter flavalbus TaxID=2579942 RepID=A0A5M8QZ01_9BACT|nr:urease accessory protein UreD [Dyadobacter flavalbus]KAA6439886.1 urease accessory protein UreD [Dyadobacter flavalbus]